MICKGYAETNNSYDANKPTSYIIYSDTNNSYKYSMMQLLPTEILDQINAKNVNLDNYSKNSPIACFLVVDIHYPDELHDLHNDYLLTGEKKQK